MAGTVTHTKEMIINEPDRSYVGAEITLSWTSNSSGAATKVLPRLSGWLTYAKTKPGSAAPSDNYDVELLDSDGFDVLEGVLHDRDTASTERKPTANSGVSLLTDLNDDYTFSVTNAGDTKSGICVLRIRWK